MQEQNLELVWVFKTENSNNRVYCKTNRSAIRGLQDYMPNIPSIKLYLNLVYNNGLPGGSYLLITFVPKNSDQLSARGCGIFKVLLITQ
jgi:hypothetical protein